MKTQSRLLDGISGSLACTRTTSRTDPQFPVYTFSLVVRQTIDQRIDGALYMWVRRPVSPLGFPLMKIGWRQCDWVRLMFMPGGKTTMKSGPQ